MQNNPLAKHFRQPQLYIQLPSKGKYYPPGTLEMPVTKELPVYPMTAKDELSFMTPDALLNGQGTVDVIQSCIPNIKDAWAMPTLDLDAVLIAIRQATYGNNMEFTSVCPHCNEQSEQVLDLSQLTGTINPANFDEPLEYKGLTFFFKPADYRGFNETSKENFEQQRILKVAADSELDDDTKTTQFQMLFMKLMELTVSQVTNSISAIKTADGVTVTEKEFINDFFQNCDKATWTAVKNKIEELNKQSKMQELDIVCDNDECSKQYKSPLLFENSNFFG